jgi:nucleotide-binding universal stress UspA family protein
MQTGCALYHSESKQYSGILVFAMKPRTEPAMAATTITSQIFFREILVASDFSDASLNAVNHAKAIAKRFGSHIVLAHVSEPVAPITVPEGAWFAEDDAQLEERVESAGVALRAEGFKADAVNTYGGVTNEIQALAEAHHTDLIVLGTHGRRGLNRLLFGSAAESIFRQASRPVLTIGPGCPETPTEWSPKTVLCASSLNLKETAIVAYAYKLAQSTEARLALLSVEDCVQAGSDEQRWRAFEEAIHSLLPIEEIGRHQIRSPYSGLGLATNIVDVAKTLRADLIVMGAKSGMFGADHLPAGVLPQVLIDARCPVLTIHTK